jgi:2-polyprenyl-3-methyl-5-hydroxy-6-metoxy-1,4-benzoquinol methylase
MPSTPSIQSNFVFEKTILNQYTTKYFVCPNCQHCQTEHPHWLDEAYQNAITNLDLGLVNRNEKLIVFLEKLFNIYFPKDIKILDYGSGYGLLLRMLRDRGFDCWGYDSYCESIFDKEHQIKDLDSTSSYDVITAFEPELCIRIIKRRT